MSASRRGRWRSLTSGVSWSSFPLCLSQDGVLGFLTPLRRTAGPAPPVGSTLTARRQARPLQTGCGGTPARSPGLAWVSHSQEDREAKDLKMDRSSKEKLSPCAIPACVRPGGQAGVLPRGCGGGWGGPVPGSGSALCPPFCFPWVLKQPVFFDKKSVIQTSHSHSQLVKTRPQVTAGALPERWTFHLPPPRVPSGPRPTPQPWTLDSEMRSGPTPAPAAACTELTAQAHSCLGGDKQSMLHPRRAPSSHP